MPTPQFLLNILRAYSHQQIYRQPHKIYALGAPEKVGLVSTEVVSHGEESPMIWFRRPQSELAPLYVLFHGRRGHWTDLGLTKSEFAALDQGSEIKAEVQERRRYRMRILRELASEVASEGAGYAVVHHTGSSSVKGVASDTSFGRDVKIVQEFLAAREISGDRVVIFGESLGCSLAVKLMASMTEAGNAPKLLSMVAPPSSMKECAHDKPINSWLFSLLGNEGAEKVLEGNSHDIHSRIANMSRNEHPKPETLIFQPGLDRTVHPIHSLIVHRAAQSAGFPSMLVRMDDAGHVNWDPKFVFGHIRQVVQNGLDSLRQR